MSISSSCVNKPMDCPLTGLLVLVWSASTFSSASLLVSTRSTDTGIQLFTGLTVLEFVLSNKTSFPISLVSKPGGCSLTGLSVLDNWVLDFGWIFWESSLPPATSESNSFLQLSFKEIFGWGRGDAYVFSYMISPVYSFNRSSISAEVYW